MGIKHASSTIFNLDQQQMTKFIYPGNIISAYLAFQNNASILYYWQKFDFIYSPEIVILAEIRGYKPKISPEIIKLAKQITNKFEDVKHCIWETEWFNEFSQHQASRRIILIEIEKDFIEPLYYELKDSSRQEVYMNPDDKLINFYIAESNFPVVIKKLITRSPISKRIDKGVTLYTPLLEKILVDLFSEEKLFSYLQGSELIHIYKNALSNYAINFTKLFSYAKRRERENDIRRLMTIHMHHLVKDIIE